MQPGIVNVNTHFVVTHITYNNSELHEKVAKIFNGTESVVAYAGFGMVLAYATHRLRVRL